MKQRAKLIKTRNVDFSKVSADKQAFMQIVEDMKQNGSMLMPTLSWITLEAEKPAISISSDTYFRETFSDAGFEQKFSTMDKMVDPWIGHVGSTQVTAMDAHQARDEYGRFIARCDHLDLWRANVENEVVAATLTIADLGSIMDLNLLYSFSCGRKQRESTLILEVGGGYGRLAEAAFNVFGDSIRYVLVDSVPGSLYYAKSYLEAACPAIRIGSYYHDDKFDLDNYECYIAPSWHFSTLNNLRYDICVSIETFQEMSQEHVDHYLSMFEEVACEDATIYISNARDYRFKGRWNYPKNWRKLLCSNTPRSWTQDHPTEIFKKSVGNFSAQNTVIDVSYMRAQRLEQRLRELTEHNQKELERRLEELREISQRDLENRLEDLRENNRKAKQRALKELREQHKREVEELRRRLASTEKKNRNLTRQLRSMRASRSWSLLNKLARLRVRC